MPDTCIIKEGEIVLLDDPRLNDPSCTIEPGAIIRPPVDETAVEDVPTPPALKKNIKVKPAPKPVDAPSVVPEPPPAPVEKVVELPKVQAHTEVPADPPPKKDAEGLLSITPEAAMVVAGVTVAAAAGAAVATSAMGGVSAVQTKLASLFGSKAGIAATAAVAAGTIVAVKALEAKMGKLETDMKKAKEDVDGAASSIDRIDQLLSRLGDDNDDKLDPSV
jgi:outer membrane biosynthesis protein TonB